MKTEQGRQIPYMYEDIRNRR